ncbi:hypothetical protein ACLJYM_14370 [Rhizobium giardinii]|uniref:hypothetical protein n=1 Tax=Rhizobium giardinii TaxID=56731 RepID=UPI0039DF7A09
MSTTENIAPAESWLKVSDNDWDYPVNVHIGASAPDADSALSQVPCHAALCHDQHCRR